MSERKKNRLLNFFYEFSFFCRKKVLILIIAEEEYPNIWNNRALGDKFFKFTMVLGMGIVFSKSIANKMGVTSGDL